MTSLSKKVMDQKAAVEQELVEKRAKMLQETQDKVFDVFRSVPELRIGDMLTIIRQLEQGARMIFESQELKDFLEDKKA